MTDETALLVPQEDYLKSGIHIGTKFKTKYMADFIYKTRPDGLSVLNLELIDQRIRNASALLAHFKPEEIMICSRRENSWKPVEAFGRVTGARVYPGRYPPGTITNPNLKRYHEAKILLISDAWPDRNALKDANQIGIPVVALCDTNNVSNHIDLVLPCNNKGKKSLGLVFYLLAREYQRARGTIGADEDPSEPLENFTEE